MIIGLYQGFALMKIDHGKKNEKACHVSIQV